MSQIERYGVGEDGTYEWETGEWVTYEAHRKREEELLGVIRDYRNSIVSHCACHVRHEHGDRRCKLCKQVDILLDAAKEEKHGTE